jgi:predicted RNA-binding protein Jag
MVLEHSKYPHEAGRLPGCPVCDLTCNCNFDSVEAGQETECVWLGHEKNQRPEQLTDEQIEYLTEVAAEMSYDVELAWVRLEEIKELRILKGIEEVSQDG